MNNIFKILLGLIIFLGLSFPGFCTVLPENIVSFVKKKFPEAQVRFDGLIELPDGTKYLPVQPIVLIKKERPLEVVKTIPSELDFAQKPDMVLFDNDFALLKIIIKEGEPPTVISSYEMPLKVKLGLLPQDLVVPKGLILPPELKVILGDLKIPLKPKTDREGDIEFYGKAEIKENQKGKAVGEIAENTYKLHELDFLKGKKLFTACYKHNRVNIVNSQTGRAETEIKLPSMAFDMTLSSDNRYILLLGAGKGEIFVVDTLNNEFVKTIPVGKHPTSLISPPKMDKAFVAGGFSSSISVIDLTNMQLERTIPVNGFPDSLQIAENKKFLFYNDSRTGKIYRLNLITNQSQELLTVKNVSRIAQLGKHLLVLSRSDNTLTVFDMKTMEVVKQTETGKKPLDMKVLERMGKILVVCAESDEINLIDGESFELAERIPLSGGFPGRIELLEDGSKALITNHDAYEIIIYNVDAEKIEGYLPVSRIINSVIVSEK